MLEDVNIKLLEAFQMYHNLMKESLLKQNVVCMILNLKNMKLFNK